MSFTFDIQSPPPAAADIATVRDRLLQDQVALERKDWKFFIGAMGVMLTVMTTALVVGRNMLQPGHDLTVIAAFILMTPYTMFFVFATSNTMRYQRIEIPKKVLRDAIAHLTELPPEEMIDVTAWGHQHAEIVAYHAAVSAQCRALVQGEVEAMRCWVESTR